MKCDGYLSIGCSGETVLNNTGSTETISNDRDIVRGDVNSEHADIVDSTLHSLRVERHVGAINSGLSNTNISCQAFLKVGTVL